MAADLDLGFDFDSDSTDCGPPSPSSSIGVGEDGVDTGAGTGTNNGSPASPSAQQQPAATPDAERQILLLMLLAQVCSLHDPTPRTFTVHVLSLFERGILDRESVRFLFDLGLVPVDYQVGTAITNGRANQNNLLEWDEPRADNNANGQQQQGREGGTIVPYRTQTHTSVKSVEESSTTVNIQVVDGVDSSDLNTGDSAILGTDGGGSNANPSSYPGQSSLMHDNDPLRDILGDDIEQATRAHRREIIEKSKAMQIADRKRREVEVQSIRAALERHDSLMVEEAGVGSTSAAGPATSRTFSTSDGVASTSVDGSVRGGPPSNYPQTQQQQPNANVQAGASWSVSSHPLSLSRYARDFESIALLASGAFGDVYRAQSNFDQIEYAIKRVCFTAAGYANTTVQTVVREVQCLAQLDHPNCVRYYTSWLEPSWMTGGGKEVDFEKVGTEEERGRLLEGVKKLVLLEDGEADESNVISASGKEDTFGTLEKDLRQMNVSPRRWSQHSYGEEVDTGFTFGSYSRGDQVASDTWDQLDSHNTYDDDSDHSSYSEWSDEQGTSIRQDISAAGQQPPAADSAIEGTHTSICSIEGGERSGKGRAPMYGGQTAYRKPPRQREHIRTPTRQYKYRICLFVQMQLCRPSTLADWIQARNRSGLNGTSAATSNDEPSERKQAWVEPAFRIFYQIVRGLAHIHSRSIIHRDLKPANIFASLDDDGGVPTFKIGDFGLSKMLLDANGGKAFESEASNKERRQQNQQRQQQQHQQRTSEHGVVNEDMLASPTEAHTIGIGTASYAAPEQITSGTYGSAADIYSLGLILLELFSTIASLHERASIFAECRKGVLPIRLQQAFPDVALLITACTDPSPSKRPTAKAAQDAIEACMREYDASPAAVLAAQKRADMYCAEVKELRKKIEERDSEVDRLKRLLAEKDAAISNFQRLLHSNHNFAGAASAASSRGNQADDVEVLGDVELTTSSSDEENY